MAPRKIALLLAMLCALAPSARASEALNAELSKDERISVDALRRLQIEHAELSVFDARGIQEFEAGRIAGARLPLPLSFYNDQRLFKEGILPKAPEAEPALERSVKDVPRDKPVVTYCNRDCTASARLLRMLKNLGFEDVRAMEEGFQAWEEKGYPVESGPSKKKLPE